MSTKIILGNGNLGKVEEISIKDNEDMELISIFTSLILQEIKSLTNTRIIAVNVISNYKDKKDV